MKILQVIDSLSMGGAEKLLVDIVPIMISKGHVVDIILLNGKRTELMDILEKRVDCNIYSLGNNVYNPFYIVKLIPYFYKYDIVHVHLFPAQYFAAISRLFCFKKMKLIFTEHSTNNRRIQNKNYRLVEKAVYKIYNKVVCITGEVDKVLRLNLNIDPKKLQIIENGINITQVSNCKKHSREVLDFTESDKLVIMVAGFRLEKDQDTVIRAISLLPDKYKLILVGDGVRKSEIEEQVNLLNLTHRVSFLGIRNDVYELFRMCDIAVLSSHWEGFGLVAVEAMGCGLPVIASNVAGLSQVVEGGGILFEKGNEYDLVKHILSLEDKSYYNEVKLSCYRKANKYDVNITVEKLLNLYYEK